MSLVQQPTKTKCFPLFLTAYNANVSKVSSYFVVIVPTLIWLYLQIWDKSYDLKYCSTLKITYIFVLGQKNIIRET